MEAEDLVWQDATGLAGLISEGTVSAVEVVAAHLDRITAVGDRVNAFVTVLGEQALQAAARPAGGPLGGVPFTVKDSFDTAEVRTTRGSRLFADRVPGRDATPVARLRQAGGILLAKTNLPEMSYWTETDNRVAGRSLNPYDPQRTPGGSSGGESAAIASGLSPLGIGSDVAISVRGPAADTGITAIKPTHGRVPMTGHFPAVPRRWWHTGPMARSVRDLRLALSLMEGADGADPTPWRRPPGRAPALRAGCGSAGPPRRSAP
ncbi:amidase [Streptomyces lydicus]|nr:amidase [Streptomyces lydicus]